MMSSFFKILMILFFSSVEILAVAKTSFLPQTFEAQFIKEEKSVLSGKTLTSKGKIFYQYPSRIRMESTGHEKTIFVSNPFDTYLYTPPVFKDLPGELTINKTKNVPLSKFFDSLEKGLETNDVYAVKEKAHALELSFSEKGRSVVKVRGAKLFFGKRLKFLDLKKIEITLLSKKNMAITLKNIQAGKKFKRSLFEFSRPANTRVSH